MERDHDRGADPAPDTYSPGEAARPQASQVVPASREGAPAPPASSVKPAPPAGVAPPARSVPPAPLAGDALPPHGGRKWWLLGGTALAVVVGGILLFPTVRTMLNTVSTDDAYVNGHVTLVAPRVQGQVKSVYVDDNYRVKKGDLLVELDEEPYQVQLAIKEAAVATAKADLTAAQAQVRGLVAQARANRYKLEHAIEEVNNQIANLSAAVENLKSKKATLDLAKANLKRGEELAPKGISKEDLDQRRQTVKVDEAMVEQALQQVYAIRAGLGLPVQPPRSFWTGRGQDLAAVPPDLDQNYSAVRQALADLLQSAAQFGYVITTWDATPKQAVADFYKQDPKGDLDRIYAHIIPNAPQIKEAEAKLEQAKADLEQAKLNLRYCKIVSDIDGVVTQRNVNPGNYLQVGQRLMAVRSLTEIWIDCNFKETQLADLRIGQLVRVEVDMYGSRREYEGRITGFTMGTGQTLALLPPQNATGNFVKIVQRLPVRVELTDYDPDKETLFVGLSCTPYVYYKEPAIGPNAGEFLQPNAPLQQAPPFPKP
jgi:membrane fusion protein, multidrug efflux system